MSKQKNRWLGTTDRFARLRRIETLDPAKDFMEISRLFYGDFRSIMMPLVFSGFMTTFAAPRMSRILASTGELEHRFAKRAVDTMLFSSMFTSNPLGSKESQAAARHVSSLHQQYDIAHEDFVLVGCDPPVYVLQLAEAYGWRPVTDKEREAMRLFYDRQARAFGSRRPLPPTVEEMKAFVDHYFDTQLHFEPQNRAMALVAIKWFADLAPAAVRPLVRRALPALIDVRVVRACGLAEPTALDRWLARTLMKGMSRRDPVRDDEPDQFEDLIKSVYPEGWSLEQIGPQHRPAAVAGATPGA